MADTYHIVFEGKLTGEVGLADTKKQLAGMFKMNATQVEALFTGKPVVIKRNVDEVTAAKFKAVFKKAGAVCMIVPAGGGESTAPNRAHPAAPASPPPAQSAGNEATGRMAGKDIVQIKVPQDLGGLAMGQAGEDIPTYAEDIDVDIPDVSGLSLSSDEEGYLVPTKETPEPKVDISGLSIDKSE